LIKASGTAEPQDQGEAKETTNGAVDQEEAKPLPTTTETVSPALVESPVTPAVVTSEETPTVQMPEDATGSSTSESEKTVVKEDEASATPSEEDSAKSIDVESVASEEKPVDMEEEESAPPKLVTKEETTADERIVEVQPQESEMTIAPEVSQPPPAAALSETLETPVSDKKRPLEKAVDGEEEDDSEHSPDAKQPRFFSPDKVISHRFYDENNDLMSFLPAGDRRQSRSSTDDRHSSRRRRTKCRDTITGNSGKTGRNGSSSSCNGKPLNHQMTNKFKNWKIFFFRVLTFSDFSKIKFFFLSSTINLLLSVSYTQLCHEWKRPTCPPPPPPPPCHVPVLFQGLFCFFHGIFG
jgi:hypothetical protein